MDECVLCLCVQQNHKFTSEQMEGTAIWTANNFFDCGFFYFCILMFGIFLF